MKKLFATAVATACLSLAGVAGAAEPVQLTDNQMDAVSAGQTSIATTGGFALIGAVASGATTSANVTYKPWYVSKTTSASAATLAVGAVVTAHASAGSSL
jgi:hypothetical protein